MLPLKLRKSAGVPVTTAVYRVIAQANAARDRKDWRAASDAYRQAVTQDPALAHIWMQLGHALKEAGDLDQAESAYQRALEELPDRGEPLLHLGHLEKLRGQQAKAGRYYYRAVEIEPTNADAVTELHRLVARATGQSREAMIDLLRSGMDDGSSETSQLKVTLRSARQSLASVIDQLSGDDRGDAEALRSATTILADLERRVQTSDASVDESASAMIFDASDLIGYYTHARLPTGIQRVQIEAITNALNSRDRLVRICCFIDGRDDWLEVPVAQFLHITQLSVRSGDRNEPDWVAALNKLQLTLTLAEPIEFPDGAYLINLGTSWWLHNYFLFVRQVKRKHGVRYIPFVHDFIPVITPEHCVKGLTQDFISWAVGVFAHADHFLVNSEATKRDLLKVAQVLGYAVDPDDVAVIRLDADFRKPETRRAGKDVLAKWRLDDDPFVLMVGTVESRKGHVVAMDAWLELIRRHGARKVPRLVCVGKNGWLNDTVYQRLQQNDELAKRVTMLSYLTDEELALLYRTCQFTVYPSLYEGWGLPITEALCYGKPVIASDNSSLPEAGGEFGVYFETGSAIQLADAVERMSFDADYRRRIEDKIKADFRPRTWRDIAHQIDQDIVRLAERDAVKNDAPHSPEPLATLGAYHPLTRNTETRIWPGMGSGEIFRTGLGWLWPDIWGCWTRAQGGELTIGVPAGTGPLRLYLLLQNFPNHECPWRLQIEGRANVTGTLRNGERKWVTVDYTAPPADNVLRLRLRGGWEEIIRMSTGGTEKEYHASVGVAGFFLCETSDVSARAAFLEAVALGNVEELNAYREPEASSGVEMLEWDDGA